MKASISRSARLWWPLLAALILFRPAFAFGERIWWDGTRDDADGPPGKLLSDNEGYWGEVVLTGVDYRYDTEPDNPADIWQQDRAKFGRRLLDGRASGSWWVPVGVSNGPLVVVLDFKRDCTLYEVDISTRSKRVAILLQCADRPQGDWRTVYERSRDDCPEQVFHRLELTAQPRGRYLRLTVEAEGISWLDEVLVWGDAEVSERAAQLATIPFSSIPGIEATAFSQARLRSWRRRLGDAANLPAVWSQVPTWDSITDGPLLPSARSIAEWVELLVARNETECAALALTNTSATDTLSANVALSAFQPADGAEQGAAAVSGQIRVAGAIGSRKYGVNLGPLFEEGNLLGASLMQRYLTNGAQIKDFPRVELPPGGSAVLWLSVTTESARPGQYQAQLDCEPGPDLTVRARVVDVTLPEPFVWLHTWSSTTSMFPFVYGDRLEREVTYKQSLGVTTWYGFPEPGTAPALAREGGRAIYNVWAIPQDYVHKGYNNRIKPEDLSDQDEQAIAEHVRSLVARAGELSLSYDDWYGELWDEPGSRNSPLFAALARIIRKTDPRVHIYCNPGFWERGGFVPDDQLYAALSPWYRELVDISAPTLPLVQTRPKSYPLFDAPHFVRAFYVISGNAAKSQLSRHVRMYRRLAWVAMWRNWNGWGFYSYHAPRGDPWDDLEHGWAQDEPDYEVVYPGPRGPVATRQSEGVREGWEDYCLIALLKDRGLNREVSALLKAYEDGERVEDLRLRALNILAP